MTRRIRRHKAYEITLQIKDDNFIRTPRESQRSWCLNRALKELGDDLVALDEQARSYITGGDPIQFIRADLLVDVGELDRAEELAKHFEEPSYASMIRGRILLVRGDAEAALAAFDEGITRWPNNAGARYLAGIAALRLGNFERASTAHPRRASQRANQVEEDALVVVVEVR